MKKKIRLTESDLHSIIKESVKKILREDAYIEKLLSKLNSRETYEGEHEDILLKLAELDKRYADEYMKYYGYPTDRNKRMEMSWDYDQYGNPNVNDTMGYGLNDDDWNEFELQKAYKSLPNAYRKDRTPRENGRSFRDNLAKDVYGTDQFDKRPLHRKGSLNRELVAKPWQGRQIR